jgi:DNA invertase Pin-like site-specific DNA recombinase
VPSQGRAVVGYARVSTSEQAREGVSLEAQAQAITAYAALHGLHVAEIIRDAGVSGKDLRRPGIQSLLARAEAGELGAIVVLRLDRLSRKTRDLLTVVEGLEAAGVAVHSIHERLDTESATGRFMLRTLASLAEMERDLIVERTREALRHKAGVGEWVGRVPRGYRVDGARLVEDAQGQALIRRARRLRRRGWSLRAIGGRLGVPKSTLARLLRDRRYGRSTRPAKELSA